MKLLFSFALCIALCAFANTTQSQDFDSPVGYLDYISKQQLSISKKYLAYASASAHGKRAKKQESLRNKLLDEVQEARMNINGMPSYKGDKSYRDSAVNFMKFYYSVLNEDYAKIVNMEEIAEQSYDLMEAYMMAREMASVKLDEANERMQAAQKKFAVSNNINLLENKSELQLKMAEFSEVNKYYNEIYLIFFKPYKQEMYLMEAVEKANITGIEQNKNALQKYAQEGLEKLAAIKSFKGDNSVLSACKRQLEFYLKEAEKMGSVSEYFLTKEGFEKMKKEFDAKGSRDKASVDAYNKSIKDINAASQAYNNNMNQLNKMRSEALNNWNTATDSFYDNHSPHYN